MAEIKHEVVRIIKVILLEESEEQETQIFEDLGQPCNDEI